MARKHSKEDTLDTGEKSPEQLSFSEFITAEISEVQVAADEIIAQCEAKAEGESPVAHVEIVSVTSKIAKLFDEYKEFALAKLTESKSVESIDEGEVKRQVAEKRAETMSDIKQHSRSFDRESTPADEVPVGDAEHDIEKKSEILEEAREFLINKTEDLKSQVELARLVLEHEGFKPEDIEKLRKIHLKMDEFVAAFEEGSLIIIEDSSGDDVEAIKVEIQAAYDDTTQGILELSVEAGVILKPYGSEVSDEDSAESVESPTPATSEGSGIIPEVPAGHESEVIKEAGVADTATETTAEQQYDAESLEELVTKVGDGPNEDAFYVLSDYMQGTGTSEGISEEGGLRAKAEKLFQRDIDAKEWDKLRRDYNSIEDKIFQKLGISLKKDLSEESLKQIDALRVRSQQYLEAALEKTPPEMIQRFFAKNLKDLELYKGQASKEKDVRKKAILEQKLKDVERAQDTILRIANERSIDLGDAGVGTSEEALVETVTETTTTETAEEDKEYEMLNGETEDLKRYIILSVGDLIGCDITVRDGATLRVYGEVSGSVIKIETGGKFEHKGEADGEKITDSEIVENYVEPVAEEPATTEVESGEEKAADAESEEATTTAEAVPEVPTVFSQEELEKQLGYLDIHPRMIFESLEESEIGELKGFMDEYRQAGKAVTAAQAELDIANKPIREAEEPIRAAEAVVTSLSKEVVELESDLAAAELVPSDDKEVAELGKELAEVRVKAKSAEESLVKIREENAKKITAAIEKVSEEAEKASQKLYAAERVLQNTKEKIVNFYKTKIKDILEQQGDQELLSDDDLSKVAERINEVIQQTIDMAAQQEMALLSAKKVKRLAARAAVDAALVIAGSFAITAFTGGIGGLASVGISSSAVSGVRLLVRKLRGKRETGNLEKTKAKEQEEVEKKKDALLVELFKNTEEFKRKLSGHISNTVREQTSGVALEELDVAFEEARATGHVEVEASTLDKIEQGLYKSALVQIEAMYPSGERSDITALEKHNMAVQLALTLGQHRRGNSEAKTRLDELKNHNPAVYGYIKKYNLFSATGKIDDLPADATEAEKSFWDKHKYDAYSFLTGAAVSAAIRLEGTTRVALGAVGGAGMGYMLAEDRNLRQEQKVFGEIGEMLKEAEAKIEDINFPVENLDFLREGSIFVKSKLELGILDSNPLLKSRAENFVHNVNKIEMKNQDTLTGLLEQVGSNTKKLGEQVEVDVSRIEKHTKRRKLLFMAGGAILGGAASFFGPGLLDKALGKVVVGEPEVDSSSSNEGGAPEVYKGTSDWKNEPDPWKSGQSDPDPWKSDVAPSMDSSETGVSTEGVDESMQSGTTVAQEQPTHFEDTIDSSEMSSGSDSIWRSAKAIFTGNAEALGYKGDLNDAAELSRWAEAQTASAVNGLNAEQGGNLADLVHDNDVVKIDIVNGKPVLSFDDASGINASHLSDTNVEKFFSDTKFEGGVEHEVQMDAQTGDQFVSLQTEDGVVKVYDWDRDGNPNVVMPDGSHQEMSTEQLKVFMEERNVAMTAEEVVTEDARVAELTRVEGVKTQIDGFLVGDTEYSNDMYAVAKADGKLDDVLHKMLSDNNTKQLEQFVGDYFKDNNMGDDKRVVFLHEISKLYGTDELRNYDGSMKRLMGAFESNVTRNYREMEFAFDQASGDKEWVPVAVGEKYALVRHDARFMRKDLFYIDINGDGVPDAIKDADAMKEVFDGKVPLATERIELDNDKTFSLKRPEASTATPDSQSSGVSPEVAAVTTDPKAVSADVVPKTVQPDLSTKEMPKVVETPLTTDAIPVLETKSADLPPNIKVDIDNNAFKVMAERGIAFKGGSLDVPGTGPIVFSKEAADTLGISPEDKGVTDTIKITTHNDLLDVEVTDKDGGVDNLVLDKDNKIIDVKHEDGVSSDTKVTQSTGVETSVEKPMDPIDYAIGTLNAGKESLNFELAKINDYDVDYLSKVKAFTEAQLAAIGKDTTNPRAISLREGMEIIDKEVAIRLKGFDSPSV